MRRARVCVALTFVSLVQDAARAQDSIRFEAASIRPAGPPPPARGGRGGYSGPTMNGGPGTADPGRFSYTRTSLGRLIFMAYQLQPDQISGPAWINTELFDVTATMPPGTTDRQAHIMFQNLLIDRFKLAFHRESRELPGYELTVAKNGPKFKESALPPGAKMTEVAVTELDPRKLDSNGYLVIPPDRSGLVATRHDLANWMTCRACTVTDLVQQLSIRLTTPIGDAVAQARIVDSTKLAGHYDFHLQFAGGFVPGPLQPLTVDSQADAGPDLFSALEQQLGLKLEKAKAQVDVLVVDHIERTPTDN